MECEYAKYGCVHKPTDTEHYDLHITYNVADHLKLVTTYLEEEIARNKALAERAQDTEALVEKVTQLEERVAQYAVISDKIAEYDIKLVSLQDLATKQRDQLKQQISGHEEALQALKQQVQQDLQQQEEKHQKQIQQIQEKFQAQIHQLQTQATHNNHNNHSHSASPKDNGQHAAGAAGVKENGQHANGANGAKKEDGHFTTGNVHHEGSDSGLKLGGQRARVDLGGEMGLLPPFIVKSSTLDTDSPSRPHNPMSLREAESNPEPKGRPKGYTWSTAPAPKPVVKPVAQEAPNSNEQQEQGIIWEYDALTSTWSRGFINFRLEKKPFAEGSLRTAHVVNIFSQVEPVEQAPDPAVLGEKRLKRDALPQGLGRLGNKYVAKISKKPTSPERYFEDVKMQMMCADLANQFNLLNTPKKIEFLYAWVLEVPKDQAVYYGLESFIEGKFEKLNSNCGAVLSDRNTPQAFSHFTYENSKHNLLVVDIQGVNDYYTDPQVHTKDGRGFGLGNLGGNGINMFLRTHHCNAICQMLKLPKINSDSKAKQLPKGTQQLPNIEDQLMPSVLPHLEVPEDTSGGEFQCVSTLTGHADRVVSLCVTPKYLFSGSGDGTVRVWNLPSYTFERELNVHRKSVESMCANEKYLFTASADHSVKVWELGGNFNLAMALRDHVGEVNAICLTDKSLNYLLSASFDKNIKVWSLRTFKCVQTLTGHSKSVKSLAVSGTILFSGSNDGGIYVWNLKFMSCIFTINAHEGWVKTLAIKDNFLYSGSFDHKIKVFDVTHMNCVATISEHNENINSICLTDNYLLSGSDDKSISVIDLATHKVLGSLKGHRTGVQDVISDGKSIYSAGDDSTIKVWRWTAKEG